MGGAGYYRLTSVMKNPEAENIELMTGEYPIGSARHSQAAETPDPNEAFALSGRLLTLKRPDLEWTTG